MFIQVIQGKSKRQNEIHEALDRWQRDCEPSADGWLGGTYGFTDDGMFVAVVRFASEEAAKANSERSEQSQWWAETEPLFDGPVEFHNCRDVMLMLNGGSDNAGFVQIVRGKVDNPERLRSMLEPVSNMLHQARPEIIGATIAIEDDGTFIETVAFTDEASARKGEGKEMPDELKNMMAEGVMRDESYVDLHHPWFASHSQMG